MKRFFLWLILWTFLSSVSGCGGSKDKGKFKDKDRPVPPAAAIPR